MVFDSRYAVALFEAARRHRIRLDEIHTEYRASHKVRLFVEQDCESIALYMQASAPYPEEMTVEFYEWANALRASLDNLFYEIAKYDTSQDPPTAAGNRQFPIFFDEEKFEGAKSLKGLHPWSVRTLRICQPFNSPTGKEGNALYWLNELARISRHRKLYEVVLAVEGLKLVVPEEVATRTTEGMIELSDRQFSFIEEDEPLCIAKIDLKSPLPAETTSGFNVSCDISYEIPEWKRQVYRTYRWRLADRMDSLEEMVDKLIRLFDEHIEKRTAFTSTASYIDGYWQRNLS